MSEGRFRLLLMIGGVGAFGLLMALEVATESDEVSIADFAVDAVIMLLTIACAASAAALAVRTQRQHEEQVALMSDLEVAQAEGAEWRATVDHHVSGLKSAIEKQFADWSMTAAEREVAFMILKGFSHKEIAALRKTSEATVRQQAQGIYRKSGMAGKNAFAAFFLEDLLGAKADASWSNGDRKNGRAGAPHL